VLAGDVKEVLDMALLKTGLNNIKVKHKPRLLSDNGPCYVSGELKEYLNNNNIEHRRGAPYHPQTQGKIERYHRTMKNIVKLNNFFFSYAELKFPEQLEKEIEKFVQFYNYERYHESINNLTPWQVYNGEARTILTKRDKIKRNTMKQRKNINLKKVI
jgi:putative transposase